jgi:fructose-1-phosphate kinase PfkB-like protein
MAGSTIVVGLNGALQKRFVLPLGDKLIPGNVHRAGMMHTGVGGKGQDVAVTLSCLQYAGNLKLAQFIGSGGGEGDLVYDMLLELLGEPAMQLTIRSESAMRTCTSIVAADSTTELVEPSGLITTSEITQLLDQLANEQAAALCIMGSMPPGCPDETYADIYDRVATNKTLCLIDSVSGLKPLLQRIAKREQGYSSTSNKRGATILKINASELCRLAGTERSMTETSGIAVTQLVTAVTEFLKLFHPYASQALNAIAITDGAHPAYLAALPVAPGDEEFRLFQLPIATLSSTTATTTTTTTTTTMAGTVAKTSSPTQADNEWLMAAETTTYYGGGGGGVVVSTLYPIGAGDAVAAGTLAAWKFLTDSSTTTSPPVAHVVPLEVQAVLQGHQSPTTRAMLAAFSFGLACGTASCRQEQNSVLKLQDACDLCNREGRPVFLSNHTMPPFSEQPVAA